jgi:phytoene dehydrogenase-like protein
MMKYDVIIIGSGLGGLTAGAKLSKEGKKVLVIEQHNRPGGCATTFRRGDYTLEVGLHEMDGPGQRDMKNRVFTDLDVLTNIEFLRVPEFYRFINESYTVTIPHEAETARQRLSELFPDEVTGINAYFEQILNPKRRSAETPVVDTSVGDFLDSIIRNDDLKLILLGNLGYFHDDPYSLSLAYYSVAQGSYFTGGASFIMGGSQKLSDHLAGYIKSHGGEVILNHTVTGIMISDKTLNGVVYNRKNSNEVIEATADEIIMNGALPTIVDMLPEKMQDGVKSELKGQRYGASLLTLYLGFRKPLKDLGNKYYSTFIYDGSVKSPKDIIKNNRADFSARSFTFVDYSQVDSGLAPEGKSVGALCCIDYLDDWDGLTGEEYLRKKEYAASVFIDRMEKIIPGLKEVVEYYEVGTPLTVKRYTRNPGGAVYGFAQVPSRKITDPLASFDNLHIASAWGKTGGGFSGAILGGYLCAVNIMRKTRK